MAHVQSDQFTTGNHHVFTWNHDDDWNAAHIEEMEREGFRIVAVIPSLPTAKDPYTLVVMVKA